ncbi:MAG: hypothetical protein K0R53_1702 [Burkholderiales bacterium]|nr:hypothetical protein [Burkholderiales bacterium]
MSKIIFLILAVLLVYWVLKAYRKLIDKRDRPPQAGGEDMVRCQHCGIHLPRSESLTTRGEFYCSADHQREHVRPD